MDSSNDEKNIFDDICLEPLIEFLSNHFLHILKLLHPNRARYFDE